MNNWNGGPPGPFTYGPFVRDLVLWLAVLVAFAFFMWAVS